MQSNPVRPKPFPSIGSRGVISYSYGHDFKDGTNEKKDHLYLPWTWSASSSVRLLADKKAGIEASAETAHRGRCGEFLGRNVLYRDWHISLERDLGPLDPDEEDDEIGAPGATDCTDWWSDPPFYGE